jgi:hypothetical protein
LHLRSQFQHRTAWLLCSLFLVLVAAALDDYESLVVISALCFFIHICLIYDLLVRKQSFRFFLISSLACGAWVTLGVVQSGLSSAELDKVAFSSFFNLFKFTISASDYALSMAYLYLFILCSNELSRLSWVLNLEIKFKESIITPLRNHKSNSYLYILAILSLFLISLSFSNLFSIRGLSSDVQDDPARLPWWYGPTLFLISLLPLLVVKVLANSKSIYSPKFVIGLLGFLVGIYFASINDRRALLTFTLSTIFSWIVICDPPLELNKKSLSRLFIFASLAILILPHVQTLFTFINYIRYDQGLYTNPILFVSSYLDFISSPNLVQVIEGQTTLNLSTRPLVLWPLAASIKMSLLGLNNGYLYFQDIINSTLNSLPRFVFQNKSQLLLQEALLYSYFPFSDVDTADSPALYSFASFWLFGSLLYPLFILTLYLAFLRFAIFVSHLTSWYVPSIFSLSPLVIFATNSYPELGTTGLIRGFFLVPAVFIGGWVLIYALITKKRVSLRSY